MKYEIPIWEKVSVWQTVNAIIDTEDDVETIYKHLKDGDFIHTYDVAWDYRDTNWDTMESVQFDYEDIAITDIKPTDEED
jgi:hypothetical protein